MLDSIESLITKVQDKMKAAALENLNTDNRELKALYQGKLEAFSIVERMLREEQIKLLG